MRTLYFDCFSGASGDMILGALLDAGASEDEVRTALDGLDLAGWELKVSEVQRAGLRGTRAEVITAEGQPERSHADIAALLDGSSLPSSVKERAKHVFAVLARAEARIHNTSMEEVHFHEVGGLDAIVDIVGCCAALEAFLPARIAVSPIATGIGGTVPSAHGVLPLPAPAVTEILQERGVPLRARGERELVTPTGAALLAVFAESFGSLPAMQLEATGYGAGAADTDTPNLLRVVSGELTEDTDAPASASSSNETTLIETNLDDMSPELVPFVIDSLLEAGAHDAWATPIVMKKGRPGVTISALVPSIHTWHAMEILFRETTTLGVRISPVERTVADRHWTEVEVAGEQIRVKIGSRHGDVIAVSPEYEDVRAAASATGLPLKEIYARALREAFDGSDRGGETEG